MSTSTAHPKRTLRQLKCRYILWIHQNCWQSAPERLQFIMVLPPHGLMHHGSIRPPCTLLSLIGHHPPLLTLFCIAPAVFPGSTSPHRLAPYPTTRC
eukprot:scaffold176426_cov22-Prasinocladus_malaysianus.AAC.1